MESTVLGEKGKCQVVRSFHLIQKTAVSSLTSGGSEMLQLTLPGHASFRASSTTQMQSELREVHCMASFNELSCWSTEGGGARMWKKGKAGKNQRRRRGQARDIAYTTQACASYSGLYWLLQSYWDMTLVKFCKTDLNEVSRVQSPTLTSTTASHACADSHYTVRASARVYQLSLYKAKTTTDVSRD